MRRAIALLAFALVLPGCITYTNDLLPQRTYGDVIARRGHPAISYTVGVGQIIGPENAVDPSLFEARAQEVFTNAGVFSSVSSGGGGTPYRVRLDVSHRRDLNDGSVLLFACSLTILPAWGDNWWTLEAAVERDGQVVKTYRYEDSTSTWFQTFLVFGYPFRSPTRAVQRLFDNMLLNFLHDAEEDQLFEER